MSQALPGEHYCLEHQGNHSHYDPTNCTVCRLRKQLHEARLRINRETGDCCENEKRSLNGGCTNCGDPCL